jgi:hypothetical protein
MQNISNDFVLKQTKRSYTKHKLTKNPLYKIWASIIQRCSSNLLYIKRGIKIYEDWRYHPENFISYVEINLGPKPSKNHSLDRIDNDKDYEPENLRWATRIVQQNNKSNNLLISYQGTTLTLAQWCKKLELNYQRVRSRYERGITKPDQLFDSNNNLVFNREKLVGKTYGVLTVIELIGHNKHQQTICRASCICGNEWQGLIHHLKDGTTQSCGCKLHRKKLINNLFLDEIYNDIKITP